MLRKKVIALTVITSLLFIGCSKSESVPSTRNANDDISIKSTNVEAASNIEPNIEVAPETEETSTIDSVSKLVQYVVPNGEYSEQCGFKNNEGKIVAKAEYDFCGTFHEGMAYLLKKNLKSDSDGGYYLGYTNGSGELVIPVSIEADYGWMLDARNFSEGLVAILNKDQWGYMDKEGRAVIPFEFDSASDFINGIATVSKDYKYGAIDRSGKVVLEFKYSHLGDFKEGLASFSPMNSDKQGFINTKGKEVIAPIWDQTMHFAEGRAAVAKGDYENAKWGFVDALGKVIIEPKYDGVFVDPGGDSPDVIGGYFENGTIDVYQEGENGQVTAITIDKNGKELKREDYASTLDVLDSMYN
ncbi:WG repeat-containing protein [Psychrobacter piscatorii]|uniref:WG repeat-containing protein n=1 Tax=Psychrobacter piscatorii TaxID=554343 RepID=UPI00191A555C|nr:WG repeat-containing protein [Psychrobacter piscatorii]